MNNGPKSNKRIVNRAEYAQVQAKVGLMGTLSAGLYVPVYVCSMCIVGAAMWIVAGVFAYLLNHRGTDTVQLIQMFMLLLLSCVGAYACQRLRAILMRSIDRMSDCICLSSNNTGLLPEPNSLVRASSQPAQMQEAVLLRASGETQEKREEQLLRATAAGQE